MCFVLKSDDGKVVSIANEQNHSHPVLYYYIDLNALKMRNSFPRNGVSDKLEFGVIYISLQLE